MAANNPLPLLAVLHGSEEGKLVLCTQKLSAKGHLSGPIANHDLSFAEEEEGKLTLAALLTDLKKREVIHHGQPHIQTIVNGFLEYHHLVSLDNAFTCTKSLISHHKPNDADKDIVDLAMRHGLVTADIRGQVLTGHDLCALYVKIYQSFIRHLSPNLFIHEKSTVETWTDVFVPQEDKQRLSQGKTLPPGWSIEEALALCVMHQSGEDPLSLAAMTATSANEVTLILNEFQKQKIS